MKLSTTTFGISSGFGIEQALRMISKAGFEAVDFDLFSDASLLDEVGYAERAAEIRGLLDKYSLECDQAHAPFDFRYGNEMNMSCERYARLVRSIEFAAMIGAPNIVIHSIGVPDGVDEFGYNLEFYKSFIPVCERVGIKISIENLFYEQRDEKYFKGRFADAEELLALLDALDSPVFDICIDVGHAMITGRNPEDVIRGLDRNVLATLHIHDNDSFDDTHVVPYLGVINWDEVCTALGEIGYIGNFNSEAIFWGYEDADVLQKALTDAAKVLRTLMEKVENAKRYA